MTNQEAIVYLEGQFDCMCSEDCQIYTGHKDCPQGFICNDGQALLTAIFALQAQPEIIRCKDCKWKQGSECVRFADVRIHQDDFCSRAERRSQ